MDINFGKSYNTELEMLTEMDKYDREKQICYAEVKKLQKEGKEPPHALEDKIAEQIKGYNDTKKRYVEYQNDALYEKWSLNDRKKRTETTKTNIVCWVTFRSMTGKDVAQKIFEHAEANHKDGDEDEVEKQFCGRFLKVQETVAMSSIKWENIHLSWLNRFIRSTIIWLIAVGIIALAFYWMVRF